MKCEDVRRDLALYLYHELDFEQEELLEQHLDGCAECRAELEYERALQGAADLVSDEPSPELLAACRRELERRLAAEAVSPSPWARLRRWLRESAPYRPALRPLGAMALIAIGFVGARLWDATTANAQPTWTRVRSLQPDTQGGVRLVLEDVRQRNVTARLEDERVRQMLLAAAEESGDPGLRVQTIEILSDLAGHQQDELDLRRTLLRAVSEDANEGVRLKAIEGLRRFKGDAETQRVLANVLLTDRNPGVRTEAINLLLEQPRAESIGALQEVVTRESNPYIRSRTLNALKALNASAETF